MYQEGKDNYVFENLVSDGNTLSHNFQLWYVQLFRSIRFQCWSSRKKWSIWRIGFGSTKCNGDWYLVASIRCSWKFGRFSLKMCSALSYDVNLTTIGHNLIRYVIQFQVRGVQFSKELVKLFNFHRFDNLVTKQLKVSANNKILYRLVYF